MTSLVKFKSPLLDWMDSIWDHRVYVPEGYEIVEKPEHKEKRLKQLVDNYEKLVEFYTNKLAEAKKELENT